MERAIALRMRRIANLKKNMRYLPPDQKRRARAIVREYLREIEMLERRARYTRVDAGTGRVKPLEDSDWPDNGRPS